jgi:hypothetical protein
LRRGDLTMPETHIVFCLISLMVHKRTVLCLDALVMAHVIIVGIVSHVGPIFLLEGLILTLSLGTWMIHGFSIVAHVSLGQLVRCKGL